MDDKINLAHKFALLDAPYKPGIVGYLNDYKLQIVKVKGLTTVEPAPVNAGSDHGPDPS